MEERTFAGDFGSVWLCLWKRGAPPLPYPEELGRAEVFKDPSAKREFKKGSGGARNLSPAMGKGRGELGAYAVLPPTTGISFN